MNAIRAVTANTAPLDDRGFIAAPTPCIKCRYDLRGLKLDGICPECSMPVGQSVSGPLLRCVEPGLLLRLLKGLRLSLAGFLCTGLSPVITIALSFLFGPGEAAARFLMSLTMAGFLLANVLLACGVSSTMSFHPASTDLEKRPERAVSMIAAIGMLVPMTILVLTAFSGSFRGSQAGVCVLIVSHALLFGAAVAGFCRYTGRILACCYRPGAGRVGSFLALFLGLSCMLVALGSVIQLAGNDQEDPGWQFVFSAAGIIVGYLCIIGTVIFIAIVLRGVSSELKIARGWADSQRETRPAS
ncbi:MAG TPA: hypothetical protein VMV94_13145 [Phycisphaerae bacterium]|nr:hypothetical protein [Phycisphaerae bacterium]